MYRLKPKYFLTLYNLLSIGIWYRPVLKKSEI